MQIITDQLTMELGLVLAPESVVTFILPGTDLYPWRVCLLTEMEMANRERKHTKRVAHTVYMLCEFVSLAGAMWCETLKDRVQYY